jgi:Right handed beta helix region
LRIRRAVLLALVPTLLIAAPALAADYPEPSNPGKVQVKPKGPFSTLHVGKGAKYKTIQAAVDKAKAGDTIRIADGTYRESVKVTGPAKRYLKIIGNASAPGKVVIDLKGLSPAQSQNGLTVNGADEVTVQGLTATHYKGNGIFAINVHGYTFANLQAILGGVYGIYAFNAVGGTMRDSVAAWNNDGGYYIGQTPPQTKPVRTLATNLTSYGNVLGWSGTNMRYVTITKSKFFNNGTGVVPNALTSEKYPPDEDNVISDNDIFWNNFNYYAGAPFPLKKAAAESTPYPVGVGVVLFGGRRNLFENNRIFGNYGAGFAALQQVLLKQVDAQQLVGNQVRNNVFNADGTDVNGRDILYDGDGSDNCFGPNEGVVSVIPADGSTQPMCPFTGANSFSQDTQTEMINWALDPTHTSYFLVHPHAPIAGLTPLETYAAYTGIKAK